MKVQLSAGASVKNTLHYSIGPFLVLAQIFGVLPVRGVWPTSHVRLLQFRWRSVAVLLTFVCIGFVVVDLFLSVKVITERGLKWYTAGSLNFSLVCLISYILLFLLSRHWPDLMRRTRYCETIFLQSCYASPASSRFTYSIRTIGALFLCGAIIEHLVYLGSGAYNNYLQIKRCNLTVNFLENYFLRERLQVFTLINYSVWVTPLLEWISVTMTFAWTFVDILIILMCRSLSIRFRQLRWRIACHVQEYMHSDFWFEIRQDFLTLVDLLTETDDKLSGLVLLCNAHNMYFLCVQIFNSFGARDNYVTGIYFWCSLLFVVARLLAVLFSAASINEATNEISSTVYEIPTAHWCLELKRLNESIVAEAIAFSGKGFYLITRRLITAMAGTILIYELVLMDQVHETQEKSDYCTIPKI